MVAGAEETKREEQCYYPCSKDRERARTRRRRETHTLTHSHTQTHKHTLTHTCQLSNRRALVVIVPNIFPKSETTTNSNNTQ